MGHVGPCALRAVGEVAEAECVEATSKRAAERPCAGDSRKNGTPPSSITPHGAGVWPLVPSPRVTCIGLFGSDQLELTSVALHQAIPDVVDILNEDVEPYVQFAWRPRDPP